METFPASLAFCAGNSPVTGEFPRTKASDAELWCFLWSTSEPTDEQTMETPVIWDAMPLLWRHCNVNTRGCRSMGHPSKTRMEFKSREIVFVHNTHFTCQIVARICIDSESHCRIRSILVPVLLSLRYTPITATYTISFGIRLKKNTIWHLLVLIFFQTTFLLVVTMSQSPKFASNFNVLQFRFWHL